MLGIFSPPQPRLQQPTPRVELASPFAAAVVYGGGGLGSERGGSGRRPRRGMWVPICGGFAAGGYGRVESHFVELGI